MSLSHRLESATAGRDPIIQSKEDAESRTLGAQIYTRLRDDIVSGVLAPDQKLRLEALKERYQVGMTPLREALYRLSATFLVVGEDRRGFRVAPASLEHFEDILETRVEVEALVIRNAFEAGDLAWEARVLAAFHRLEGTAMYESNSRTIRKDWEVAHRLFHEALLSTATRSTLLRFQQVLWDHSARYRNLVQPSPLEHEALEREHRGLLDAVLARDPEMACLLQRRHIRNSGEPILAALKWRASAKS